MKTKLIAAGLTAGALTAVSAKVASEFKTKKHCPLCAAKSILNKTRLSQSADTGYNNGVALTPPMGWSSWNLFATKINEDLIKEIADAMDKSGLREAGYNYVNIDDCWQASSRDENGKITWDRATFPSGIPSLVEYVNSKGMKLGIYSSNGTHTCEDYPASLRHECVDADTFASWGIEYFKYDFCHNKSISSKAPKVCLIELSRLGEGAFKICKPSETNLKGLARTVKDDDKKNESREYIDGISSRSGSFSITVDAPEYGEYAVTFTVKKEKDDEKFLRITVNSLDEYHVYSTKVRTEDGVRRVQQVVTLEKGRNELIFDNPVGSKMDSAAMQYKLMGRELKRATKEFAEKKGTVQKPIVFSLCEWGLNKPYKWGMEAGNLWRTTPDIKPFWVSVLGNYEVNVRLDKYSDIGAWNDPDMLEVGNGKLTYDENKAHFSLWCMMCAPLILGNDIRKFILPDGTADKNNKVYKILTNKKMIAINQDRLGVQCKRIKRGLVDVLVKPLENSAVAVCVFNKGTKEASTEINLNKIANLGFVNLEKKSNYSVYDVWEDKAFESKETVSAKTTKHGVKVYIIK